MSACNNPIRMMQDDTSAEFEFVDYLTCASRLAESFHGAGYVEIAEAIALQYVVAGQLEQAVEQAEQIPDAYVRDSVFAIVTAKAVAAGRDDDATELLNTIEEPILHNSAVEGMSIEFARRGEFDTALGLTDELSDNASALGSIAIIYWQHDLKDEAVDLARSIDITQQSAMTLAQLASLSSDKDESLNLLAEAREVAEDIESAELKVFTLTAIASVYEKLAEREHCLDALNHAFEVCDDFESGSLIGLSANFPKDEALLEIVQGLLRLDDLSKATEVADAIDDQFLFARANLGLAVARGKGEPGEAEKYLDEAMAIISELQPYSEQEAAVLDALIIDLAMSYANSGNYDKPRRIVPSVRSEENQRLALTQLGKLCAGTGDDSGVLKIEGDLRGPYDKVQYWLGIYDASSSHPELSESALTKALANAEGLEQPVEKSEAFTEIALRFAKSQRTARAESLFRAATGAVSLIDGNFLKARALLHLAKASQDTGREPNQDEQRLLEEMMNRV